MRLLDRSKARLSTIVIMASLMGCGGTSALHVSDKVPAAKGNFSVVAGDNGNSRVTVNVSHLAAADKVGNGATTYVVWVQPKDAKANNVGALQIDDDLSGSLEIATPYKDGAVFITAEVRADVTEPAEPKLLWGNLDE